MNWNMVEPEKFDYLHLVYHFTVPLNSWLILLFTLPASHLAS